MIQGEWFYRDGRCTGVLLRDIGEDEMATFIAFELNGGDVYHAEQVTELGPDATGWSSFRFTEHLSGTSSTGTRTTDGLVLDGVAVAGEAIPSYLMHRVVTDMARSGEQRRTLHQVDEHGDRRRREVTLLDRGADEIELPGGASQAQRFDLLLDGRPHTAFWWDGAAIVASDWTAGSTSVLAPDLTTAIDGAPVPVAALARAWVVARQRVP